MYLVNDLPWVDLSAHIDVSELEKNRSRFAYVIAKYPEHIYTSLVGVQANLYDQTQIELGDFAKGLVSNPDSEERQIANKLGSLGRFYTYCKYMHPVVSLNQAMYIRIMKQDHYGSKHLRDSCIDTPITHEFDFLFNWIGSQNVFNEYGRVVMFINEPGVQTITHRDYPNPRSHRNEFIWLTLNSLKKFFVLNDDGSKNYVDSPVAYFDNANWHGSDPSQFANWSLRIDGVFSDDFLNRTGLYDHFRGNR
jgi:hypothetical protein